MKPQRDPEGAELVHFLSACTVTRAKVLEIGCGNGVFTRQYAGLPALLVGIDPNAAELREARQQQPDLPPKAHFTRAIAEAQPFSQGVFDVVLFASSF